MSIAFDTVNHNILLEKLKAYGIQSENLKWFRSYLSNRKQFISFGDSKTEMKFVKCGVPQGSVLGPLLLLIFAKTSTARLKFLILYFLRTMQTYFVRTIIKGLYLTRQQIRKGAKLMIASLQINYP